MNAGTGTKVTHILLLEDDKAHQELILRMFRDDPEQFRISVAGTVRDAREIIGRENPDLIISDWILPDGKGIEVLPRTDGVVTIPLIIMTSFGDERLAVEIMKSGAIDYVVKSATIFHEMPHIARRALRDWNNIQERKRAEQEKQDSEKRLADIISFLPDAVLAIDNDGRVIAWNEAIELMTGVASEEMLLKGNYEYSIPFYGERRPILIDLIQIKDEEIEKKYLTSRWDGERISSEVYIPTLFGGKGAYLWGTASPLYNSAGDRIGAIEIIRDITERKRAEMALQEKEATLEMLLNAPTDTIALLDRQGTILSINEEGARRLGGNVQGVTGLCAYDLLPPDVASVRKKQIDRVFESGEPTRFDDTRSGMYLHNEIFPIFNPELTAVDRIAIFARDITFQKQAELALLDSETRYRDLFENMSSGVVIYEATPDGKDFTIRDLNQAVETIEQVKKNEIIGKSVLEIFPGVVEFGLFAVFQRVAKTGIAESHPVSIYRDNRISGWRENYVYKLPSGEVVALYEDVTDKKKAEEETQRLLIAVEEEKEKLTSLINSITDEVWFTDTQHRFILANPPALKEFGLDHGGGTEVENLAKCLEVLRSDGTPRPLEEAPPLRALAGETVNNLVEIVRTPARGELRYRQVSAAPVKDHFGTIVGAVSVVRDITEQNRVQEALRESELRYRSVIENAAEGITVAQDGKLQYTNTRLLEMTQVSSEEIANRPFTDFVHPDDRVLVFERYQRRISGEDPPQNYDFRILGKNGKIVWVQLSAVRIEWNGKPATLNFLMDITGRKIAEDKIRESEERYRALLFGAGIGVGYWTIDGTLLFLNEISLKRLNGKEEDFTGKNLRELFGDADAEMYLERIRNAALSPDPMEYEDYISLPVGKGWYLSVYTRITGPDGTVRGIQVLSMDITERKQNEDTRKSYEARMNSAMEIGNLAWWEMDLPDGAVRFDDRKAIMLGHSPEQFHHYRDFTALLHPDDYEPAMKAMRNHLEGRESRYHADYRILDAAGDYLWFRDVGGITKRHADGSPAKVTGIVIDITASKMAEESIRTNETRFQALIQNSSDIIRILDRHGLIVYESASAERILGYPPDFMIGKDPFEYIHPDDIERVKKDLRGVYENENDGIPTEFRVRKANGEYHWVDSIGINLLDVAGVNGVVVTTRSIQQRKQAEEQIKKTLRQLERSEALLRKVYDILPIGLWLADKKGKIFYGNPAGIKIWGADTPVQIEKYGVFKARRLPSGEEIATDDWALGHTIHEGVTIKDEMIEIDAFDGKKKIILNYTAPLYDAAGILDGAIVVNQEITDKVKVEEALRENQTRLSTAMDIAGLVNWEFDVTSGMFTFDDRFYTLYETTAEREGGNQMPAETYMREFVYPDDRPAVLASIQKILATTDPNYAGQIEHRITPRDGSVRTIIARFAPVMGPDGKVIRTFGANQDITDFKLMESEIRSLNIVLEQRVKDRTEALLKANEALEEENAQRLEAEGKLQASYNEKVMLLKEIHHRVKNNLQIIASLLNLQSRYIADEKTLAAIRESQNRVKAMALVHEKLYRSEDIAHISLHDYIRFLGTGLFQFYDAKARGIQFKLEISDIDLDIDAAIPLGLIINELISNSLKYAFPEGRTGEVSISVKRQDHILNVLFHDTGIGIPADLDWRNAPSLGLRLVITLVDQMDGTVELDRSEGTRFTMVLHEKETRSTK